MMFENGSKWSIFCGFGKGFVYPALTTQHTKLPKQLGGQRISNAPLVDVNYPGRSATTILAGGSGE
jgi:hypothetical protein